jgi:uncharacterized protein
MIYERSITKAVLSHLSAKEATIIIGARQTGKTTLLRMLQKKHELKGEPSFYLTLENPEYLAVLNESPLNIFQLFPKSAKRTFVFIDEIQYLDDPSGFIKLLYDEYSEKLKLVATGSSAFFIDQKFTDSLVGRKRIFTLMTLSFMEFLSFKKNDALRRHIEQEAFGRPEYFCKVPLIEREVIIGSFREYARFGGFPRVVLRDSEEEKKLELEELVNSYIKKDILESGVRKEEKFFHLLRILAANPGSLLNIHEASSTLRISATAVEHFLYIITKSFHGTLVRPFYQNVRSELTKMPRFFFNDTGIRNFLAGTFTDKLFSHGGFLENMVYTQLSQRCLGKSDEILYWRTQSGTEVDFVLPGRKIALEAKTDHAAFRKSKVKLFTSAYPEFSIAVVTWFDASGGPVAVYPVWAL